MDAHDEYSQVASQFNALRITEGDSWQSTPTSAPLDQVSDAYERYQPAPGSSSAEGSYSAEEAIQRTRERRRQKAQDKAARRSTKRARQAPGMPTLGETGLEEDTINANLERAIRASTANGSSTGSASPFHLHPLPEQLITHEERRRAFKGDWISAEVEGAHLVYESAYSMELCIDLSRERDTFGVEYQKNLAGWGKLLLINQVSAIGMETQPDALEQLVGDVVASIETFTRKDPGYLEWKAIYTDEP